MKKAYYAIIPANVRYDKRLTPNAKLLYGEITALCNEKGFCWATNNYFAELYEVSNRSISTWVNQLADFGYIKTQLIYREGTKEVKERRLHISSTPMEDNFHTPIEDNFHTPRRELPYPIEDNFQDNTTLNNTVEYKDIVEDGKPISNEDKIDTETVEEVKDIYKETSEEYKLAKYLVDKIIANNERAYVPEESTSRFNNWVDDIDKLHRLGAIGSKDKGYSYKEIKELIDFCQEDNFWWGNILSPGKLREQVITLENQMNRDKKPKKIEVKKTRFHNFEARTDNYTKKEINDRAEIISNRKREEFIKRNKVNR